VGVAIPIPGLPPFSAQVQAWHASIERRGAHPASVAARKRTYKPRAGKLSGKGIEAAVLRAVGKRIVHLHDIYGAMPTAPISSIKASITHLVQSGALVRPRKACYRAGP
jgi:hypothetical protein